MSKEACLEEMAMDYLQRPVSLIYREIGVLRAANHPEVYAAARTDSGFFGPDRKRRAAKLYVKTRGSRLPSDVTKVYEDETGLTLRQVLDAFCHGEWRTFSGGYAYGGPKWAVISEYTIELGEAISVSDWDGARQLLSVIELLEHNSGRIVDKFPDIDRQLR